MLDVGVPVTDVLGYTESLPSDLDISACSGALLPEGVDYQTFSYSLSVLETDGKTDLELSALCQDGDSQIYVAVFSEAPVVCTQYAVACGDELNQELDVGDYTIVVTGEPADSAFELCVGCADVIPVDLDIGIPDTELGDGGGGGPTDSLPTELDIASCEGLLSILRVRTTSPSCTTCCSSKKKVLRLWKLPQSATARPLVLSTLHCST